jgi:hypothetical protein
MRRNAWLHMTTSDPNTPPPADQIPETEYVPADDQIIGQAFKWSFGVILIVAIAIAGTVMWLGRGRTNEVAIIRKDFGEIKGLDIAAQKMPHVVFRDVTRSAGIDFVHFNGAVGDKMLPETMGSGCAFLDYDNDGDQDILLVNGTNWPWDNQRDPPAQPALYRNDGSGQFENVTSGSGLDISFYGTGVACGDYDNDGNVDVFIAAVGTDRLFRNLGGRFKEVTCQVGVSCDEDTWGTSSAFFDFDNDGDLDLFVCNYVEWSRKVDLELNFTLNGTDRAYGPPTAYKGAHSYLYRNEGNGTFTDISAEAGVQVHNPATGLPVGKSLALAIMDLDDDRDLDMIVANDTTQNFLFENRGDGTFREDGVFAGLAYDGMGRATGAMGIDVAYYRNDRDLAVSVGNFANEMTSFFVRQPPSMQFSDDAVVEGIGSPSRAALSFGLFFFDYDLDGRSDLFQTNGHLDEEINEIQPSQHYRQPAQLFWNRGPDSTATFAVVPDEWVGDLSTPIVGRGAAYADIDADGDLDVILTQSGDRPILLRNDQQLGHHWLRLKLRGTKANRDGIGARVELTVGDATQVRYVMPTRSYLSQVELPVTFGLGQETKVNSLRVIWPGGLIQQVTDVNIDTEMIIEQSDAT